MVYTKLSHLTEDLYMCVHPHLYGFEDDFLCMWHKMNLALLVQEPSSLSGAPPSPPGPAHRGALRCSFNQ
jgi:hypothetical protein